MVAPKGAIVGGAAAAAAWFALRRGENDGRGLRADLDPSRLPPVVASRVMRSPARTRFRRRLPVAISALVAGLVACAPRLPAPPPASPEAPPESARPEAQPVAPFVEPVDDGPHQIAPEGPSEAEALPRATDLGRCETSGKAARVAVRVDPPGGSPFLLSLQDAPLTATVAKGSAGTARVSFAGAIRFQASAHDLVVRPKRALVLEQGMIRTPRNARFVLVGEAPDGLVRVLTSIGIETAVPCDALEIGGAVEPPNEPAQAMPVVSIVGEGPLLLAPSPGAAPTLEVPRNMLFTRLAGRVDFLKIAHRGWDGVVVSGYAPAPRIGEVGGFGTSGGRVGCGCMSRKAIGHRRASDDPYTGLAKLRAGASIHASREGAVWAEAAEADVHVHWDGGVDAWVRIETIPHVDDLARNKCQCPGITHAFARRADVSFLASCRKPNDGREPLVASARTRATAPCEDDSAPVALRWTFRVEPALSAKVDCRELWG